MIAVLTCPPPLPDHHHPPETSAYLAPGALLTSPPYKKEKAEEKRVRNGLMSGTPSSFMSISAYGSRSRPRSWDTFKQGFSLPPTSHSRKLRTKLGWGLWEEQVPIVPRTNASQHIDLHLEQMVSLWPRGKKTKRPASRHRFKCQLYHHLRALG